MISPRVRIGTRKIRVPPYHESRGEEQPTKTALQRGWGPLRA
jgi:hypothetical protein